MTYKVRVILDGKKYSRQVVMFNVPQVRCIVKKINNKNLKLYLMVLKTAPSSVITLQNKQFTIKKLF